MADFPFDIVGFDLDGTLLDTHGDLGEAVNHAMALAGRPRVPMAKVYGLVGGGSKRMLARALDLTGGMVDDDAFDRLHGSLLDYYESHISVHSALYSGGEAALDELAARGTKLAVVTNKLEHLAVRLLDELGLSSRFYTILGGDSLGPGKAKPAPDLIHAMIARGGGGRAAYVGDTTYDTGSAQAAGIPCIAVSFGYNNKPVDALGAAAVIDHYDELVSALERLG
ncbi:MAG: HAD hydrolase-like protein [Sphingomonadaceae bacterium]|nr:HAD hydrolase-like protein [Sphingomonadaceae bacterium]